MLVLSRKVGERILLGEDVVISVVRIGPNTVKIGIDAPKDMNIVREELCLNLAQANLTEMSDSASGPIRKPR
jgi:carbon storage regulator